MLKTAIAGADSPVAGELIRLLVNHSEIDLHTAFAPAHRGRRLCDVHYGLVGETDSRFSDTLNLCDIDVLFICTPFEELADISAIESQYPDLRIIDLSATRRFDGIPYGLSEINRKELVRGARISSLASAEAAAALIALYPAACNLLIPPGLRITIRSDIASDPDAKARITEEISPRLRMAQSSFMTDPEIALEPADAPGIVAVTAEFSSSLDARSALALFDAIYDDHNFTHLLEDALPGPEEICGTNRCMVFLSNPAPGRLRIDTMLDGEMRGGATGALHIMNLLCGLHEKTGLALRATGIRPRHTPDNMSANTM